MRFASLIDAIPADSRPVTLPGAENWMQGRTLFGGASAALALEAARRALPGLPPFRAAQVGFVAPVGANLAFTVEIVRQGRNVTQVRSDIASDGKLALTALMLFGDSREPNAVHPAARADPWPGPPEDCEALGSGPANFFTQNMEIRRAQDERGRGVPIMRRWVRLRERDGLDPIIQAIVLGDALPPGSMRAMQRQGPLSSINWSFNLLDPEARTRDGWFLAETAGDHADHGYSSERLRLWNADGQQVLAGMQAAAIFG
ncbi:thioesterase family protein [Altererythrobacter aerius]|uniref:Thioesterase family protein n=1 Tax=Tsuneonella aeria TaxID=1837929 RepID=A0A6I4TJ21_9SPHN|nr:thioesterase family protein [Tsuneonella aeria]MXO76040.1 thioesterase family protein [Tsuneonella aeria]